MTESDLDSVLAVEASLVSAPHWNLSAYRAALDVNASPKRIAMIAKADSKIVAGFIIGSLVFPLAELESIAVAIDFQRQGLGRQMLNCWLAHTRAAGAEQALLELRASNQQALSLYRSTGWIEVGRRRDYYSAPREDAIVMRLSLQ
jgi:ribosomal-protein-alanine N-acetyltransferase